MTKSHSLKSLVFLFLLAGLFICQISAQEDSVSVSDEFNSQLLTLKVPEAFAQSSLKLEVFTDSSWQLYQGQHQLNFNEALHLLGLTGRLLEIQQHMQREQELSKAYRSRRVFSIISGVGGATYLAFIWEKGWVYQIPGYAAIAVASARYFESRKIEVQALREKYYQDSLISPSEIQAIVDDYNFRLYQYLSNAGIQFREK